MLMLIVGSELRADEIVAFFFFFSFGWSRTLLIWSGSFYLRIILVLLQIDFAHFLLSMHERVPLFHRLSAALRDQIPSKKPGPKSLLDFSQKPDSNHRNCDSCVLWRLKSVKDKDASLDHTVLTSDLLPPVARQHITRLFAPVLPATKCTFPRCKWNQDESSVSWPPSHPDCHVLAVITQSASSEVSHNLWFLPFFWELVRLAALSLCTSDINPTIQSYCLLHPQANSRDVPATNGFSHWSLMQWSNKMIVSGFLQDSTQ